MRLISIPSLCLTIGLALLTVAVPTFGNGSTDIAPHEPTDVTTSKCCDFTPIEHHHGFATVEVWAGRPGRNAGFLNGDEMRAAVWNMVGHLCPEQRDQCRDRDPGRCVYVDYVSKLNPFPVELKTGTLCMGADGSWENAAIRQLLIDTAAEVFVAATNDPYNNLNCYEYPGRMMCNIPDQVHVNLPPLSGERETRVNQMNVWVHKGGDMLHEHHCCESRERIDAQLDTLYGRITEHFHEDYGKFRLVQCMVGSWTTCEQCYMWFDEQKCKRCGSQCQKLD